MVELTLEQMLKKLDELYNKEDMLKLQFEQLREEIELLQYMIMHLSNKQDRTEHLKKYMEAAKNG